MLGSLHGSLLGGSEELLLVASSRFIYLFERQRGEREREREREIRREEMAHHSPHGCNARG